MYSAPYFPASIGVIYIAYLMPIQSNGSKGQHRHVNRAVLNKPAYVTHQLPKNPGTAYKPHLKNRQNWIKTVCIIYRVENRLPWSMVRKKFFNIVCFVDAIYSVFLGKQ